MEHHKEWHGGVKALDDLMLSFLSEEDACEYLHVQNNRKVWTPERFVVNARQIYDGSRTLQGALYACVHFAQRFQQRIQPRLVPQLDISPWRNPQDTYRQQQQALMAFEHLTQRLQLLKGHYEWRIHLNPGYIRDVYSLPQCSTEQHCHQVVRRLWHAHKQKLLVHLGLELTVTYPEFISGTTRMEWWLKDPDVSMPDSSLGLGSWHGSRYQVMTSVDFEVNTQEIWQATEGSFMPF